MIHIDIMFPSRQIFYMYDLVQILAELIDNLGRSNYKKSFIDSYYRIKLFPSNLELSRSFHGLSSKVFLENIMSRQKSAYCFVVFCTIRKMALSAFSNESDGLPRTWNPRVTSSSMLIFQNSIWNLQQIWPTGEKRSSVVRST